MTPRLDPDRPKVPDVLPIARAYVAKPGNSVGGSLHIVLSDRNLDTPHVEWCVEYARARGDTDGVELGELLLRCSKTQRGRIAVEVWETKP